MIPDIQNSTDVAALRADTPSCIATVHLNNAGASPTPEPVHRAMVAHLDLERRIGGYAAAERANDEVASFNTEVAALLGAAPEEIAFATSATRAWTAAFHALDLKSGDRIIIHESEYSSNHLEMIHQARRREIVIDVAPSNADGEIDLDALVKLIKPKTRVLALTHASSSNGLINPADTVGHICHEYGLLYLLDASQSAGQLVLDVNRIGCDILTGAGRKFLRGPRGTGFLYVRRQILDQLDPPAIDLHSASWIGTDRYELASGARRFETFEQPVAARIGLARAVRYARDIGIAQIESRIGMLAARLREMLTELPGVTVHDHGRRQSGIVTFSRVGESPATIRDRLRHRGIEVSVTHPGAQCFSSRPPALDGAVRASLHCFNTEAELMRLVGSLQRRA